MASEVVEDGQHTGHHHDGLGGIGHHPGHHVEDSAVNPNTVFGGHDKSVEGGHHGEHLGHHGEHHSHLRGLTKSASGIPKEYETRVQIIQRYPELKSVEETYYVKEIRNEKRIIRIPKTRVVMEEHERFDKVPVIKEVERKRIEIVHRVVQEEKEVTELVKVVEMVDVPRREVIPRVITEEIEEEVEVPTLVEVPKIRLKEVHTGQYLEAPAGEYVNPGHFNLLDKGHGFLKHRKEKKSGSSSSSSSSSSDDEKKLKKGHKHGHGLKLPGAVHTGTAHGRKSGSRSSSSSSSPERQRATTTSSSAPTTPKNTGSKKKPSLLQRIEAKFT